MILIWLGLVAALFVTNTGIPLAGSWFILVLAYGFKSIYAHNMTLNRTPVGLSLMAWLAGALLSGFIINPLSGAAVHIATFCVISLIPLCLMHGDNKSTWNMIVGCYAIILIYALNLIYQQLFWTGEQFYYLFRSSWPLYSPNNAAAIVNMGLIVSALIAYKTRSIPFIITTIIFTIALLATKSYGGILSALFGIGLYAFITYPRVRIWLIGACSIFPILYYAFPGLVKSLVARYDLWEVGIGMIKLSPLKGLGIGGFAHYYALMRKEPYTTGGFVHNDYLQFAIEMGIPIAAIFIALIFFTIKNINKNNIIPACAILTVMLHSFIDFHLYLPPVMVGLGVLYACYLNEVDLCQFSKKQIRASKKK